MGDTEVGKCEVCGIEEVQLHRTYIQFPSIKCRCHNRHSILIRHCKDCTPTVPEETKIEIGVAELRAIDMLIRSYPDEYDKALRLCREHSQDFRQCDEVFKPVKSVASACEAMGMAD